MLFRDKFLLSTGRPLGEDPSNWIAKVTEGGFRVSLDTRKAQMKLLKAGFEHVAQTQNDASEALRGELAYQADRLGRQIAQGSEDIVAAVGQGSQDMVESIQRMSDYLGAGLSEVRWAVERHSRVSEEMLKVLVESLSNESRQYFDQGFKCYETNEYEFAKKTFNKALEANITNHFAYQYLGIIAVAENNPTEAFRNFDLARKFSDGGYHRALALSHLARSHHAVDELEKAADLAESATQAYAELAKFWYELAGYSARLGRAQKAMNALKEAIERDWMYFTVVAGDTDFDSVRGNVCTLLDGLRERERKRARQALDRLQRIIDEGARLPEDNVVSDWTATLKELERQYSQRNVFLYREVLPKANVLQGVVLETLKKILSDRIEVQKKAIDQIEADKRLKIYSLSSTLDSLKSETHTFQGQEFSLYLIFYIILLVFTFPTSCFVITVSTRPTLDQRGSIISQAFWIALIGPALLIGGIELARFLFGTALPEWSVSRKKDNEQKRIRPAKEAIEKDHDKRRRSLEAELNRLKAELLRIESENDSTR